MRTSGFIFLFFLFCSTLYAQREVKTALAVRTSSVIKIDGKLTEAEWNNPQTIKGFTQYIPNFNNPASFATEVHILFDNYAIYIGARMYDPHPDSILRQLGNRDDENLNADYFGVEFDTYNNQLDAYGFTIYGSGVQSDMRRADNTYDAVWESAVSIDDQGWTAEIKIPYSALRFPAVEKQSWGLQLYRSVRRYREVSHWSLEPKGVPNELIYWGKLEGLEKIVPPLRLSVTPYLSVSIENSPGEDGKSKDNSTSFAGGADLKYGINESFTVDMTLLPDFSQVQSDNQIKNLSAFETIFEEQRPFFQEAVDLFQSGGLFYSRRIGRIPLFFYDALNQIHAGDKLIKNPPVAKLVNATKFSGRNKNGLAIGLFNALTANTYAVIEDSLGRERKFLTDPKSNYNIIVFDQSLKNNSSFYLINTNVIRDKGFNNANVTGSGFTLFDKKNILKITGSGALSQIYEKTDTLNSVYNTTLGIKYSLSISKAKGRLQYGISQESLDDHFSANDMGATLYNNSLSNEAYLAWHQFEPKGMFREMSTVLEFNEEKRQGTHEIMSQALEANTFGTLNNYLSYWGAVYYETKAGFDFYEARIPGRFYLKPRYFAFEIGESSDYRKTLAIDTRMVYLFDDRDHLDRYEFMLRPLVRASNHLFFQYEVNGMTMFNDIGFAGFDSLGASIFGKRKVVELENALSGKYIFKNNLAINLYFRHYWSNGEYSTFYTLNPNGSISENPAYHPDADFNFNSLNIDLVFYWEFAPGSRLNLIWKNAILSENSLLGWNYFRNFHDTWESPQSNTITLKFLYYLDYQHLKRNKSTALSSVKIPYLQFN